MCVLVGCRRRAPYDSTNLNCVMHNDLISYNYLLILFFGRLFEEYVLNEIFQSTLQLFY